MPSLNNMEMAAAVAANKNIEIKKTFFGLKTQVIYTPTGSPVDCYRKEYAPDAESSLGKMLDNTGEKLAEVAKNVADIKEVDMGNVRLEAALSRDHQFAALQIVKFTNFNYLPVSEVKFLEGADAAAVATVFK